MSENTATTHQDDYEAFVGFCQARGWDHRMALLMAQIWSKASAAARLAHALAEARIKDSEPEPCAEHPDIS